jgi:hypothetical protein
MQSRSSSSSTKAAMYDSAIITQNVLQLAETVLLYDCDSWDSSSSSDVCELVLPAVTATLAVWRNAAGTAGVQDLQWDPALGAANKVAFAISSWLQYAGAAAEGMLQHPDVATLLAIQVARAAHALHQAHSSISNSSSSSGQDEQQQQHAVTPADTTNTSPTQLYQLLLNAAGVPGLGSSSNCSSSDVYDDMYDLVNGAGLPMHLLRKALRHCFTSWQELVGNHAAGQKIGSSSSSSDAGTFSVTQQRLPLLQTLASVLLLLPPPLGHSPLDSLVVSTAREAMQMMLSSAAASGAESMLPLLLHSVVPAVVAMLQQGNADKAAAAGTVSADQQQQLQQRLLTELWPLLGSLVTSTLNVALIGAAGI